jgi:hypothetical protein
LATDLLFDYRPPRNQAEAEPIVDHGEPAAGELRRTEKLAAHRLPLVDGLESEAAFGRQFSTDALDLLASKGADEVGSNPRPALGRPAAVPLPDQLVGAPLQGLTHLGAESGGGERAAIAADELAVEPSRAVAGHLPVEVVGAKEAHLGPASLGGLIGGGTGLEVLRDQPAVGIGPLHDAGAAKRFEAPDMSADIGVMVSARDTDIAALGKRPMLAWTIDPGAAGDLGDVVVGRPLGTGAADFDDGAERRLLGG